MPHTYGTRINPALYIEQPDPAAPGQVERPDGGTPVYVRDAQSGADLPTVTTDSYGYVPTFTVPDSKSIFLSTTLDWANPIGPIASREAIDTAINGTAVSPGGGGGGGGVGVLATANGVKLDGSTDDRPLMQALINSCYTLGLPILLGPGTLRLASVTDGTNRYALKNPGVNISGVPGETTIRTDAIQANAMWIGSTMSTTAVATITADVTVGTKNYQVDSSTGFTVGDKVAARLRQNASDIQEVRQGVIATVTAVPDSTHLTLDVAAEWDITGLTAGTTTEQQKNHQITKITSLPSDVRIEGIRFVGDNLTRHAIGIQWAQRITIDRCVGVNVGSGLVNWQWTDGVSITNCAVEACAAYGDPNKGRALSGSNERATLISNFVADGCEGAQFYFESYSTVRMENITIHNRAATRSQPYNIFCGQDCLLSIDGYTHTGSVADSIVTYGTGPGVCNISNATIFAPIGSIRQFPLTTATGLFRVLDSTGVLRTFNTIKLEKSQVRIDLAAGTSQVKWLRDGLHVGYEVLVSAGVTTGMLTTLAAGRTSVASIPLAWTAGSLVRSTTFVGGGLYPMASTYGQGTKVTATVASGAALPTGAFVLVTLLSVQYEGAVTAASEPGSLQTDRFNLGVGTATTGGGTSSGPLTLDDLPAGVLVTVVKSTTTWPARPTARTDLVVEWIGPDPDPAGMLANDKRTLTPT